MRSFYVFYAYKIFSSFCGFDKLRISIMKWQLRGDAKCYKSTKGALIWLFLSFFLCRRTYYIHKSFFFFWLKYKKKIEFMISKCSMNIFTTKHFLISSLYIMNIIHLFYYYLFMLMLYIGTTYF